MQEPINTQELDSDVRAHLDQQYESNLLGHFTSREDFKASLTKESYPDTAFGLIDGEIVMAFEVFESKQDWIDQEATAVDAAALANAAAALAPGLGDDVKFTEASPFEASAESAAAEFLPLEFVVVAMESAKIDQAFIDKIKKDCHPDAGNTVIPEGQRIFLVNRALRLAISEAELEDTIQVRMLISDQLSADNWRQIIVKGLIPAIKGTLPLKKAK